MTQTDVLDRQVLDRDVGPCNVNRLTALVVGLTRAIIRVLDDAVRNAIDHRVVLVILDGFVECGRLDNRSSVPFERDDVSTGSGVLKLKNWSACTLRRSNRSANIDCSSRSDLIACGSSCSPIPRTTEVGIGLRRLPVAG